jgi:hypothetical protein
MRGLCTGHHARREVLTPPQPRLSIVTAICPQLLWCWGPPLPWTRPVAAATRIYTGERSFWWRLGLAPVPR